MTIFLSVLCVVFAVRAAFAFNEHRKKSAFIRDFFDKSNQLVSYHYPGSRVSPGMQNIAIRAKNPFCVLVGSKLQVPFFGEYFAYYGFVQSNEQGLAVFSTYLGKRPVVLALCLNTDLDINPATVHWEPTDELTPTAVFLPHCFQKYLGNYA